jgi:hypothetical protein
MKIKSLHSIDKLYFRYEDIAKAFGIGLSSAKIAAARYVKYGLLLRLKRNTYILRGRWKSSGKEERFMLANLGQSHSYISLMTALD